LKNYTALAKLDTAAYKTFEKMCYWEFIERWDDPEFKKKKKSSWMQKKKTERKNILFQKKSMAFAMDFFI